MTRRLRGLEIRLTPEERLKLERECKRAGFHFLADYVRHVSLDQATIREERLVKILRRVDELHSHLLPGRRSAQRSRSKP